MKSQEKKESIILQKVKTPLEGSKRMAPPQPPGLLQAPVVKKR